MLRLQGQLCELQEWVRDTKAKIIILFEGRDAAGKGGMIRRFSGRVSPRVFRVVALPAPTEREKSQVYLQRYVQHFPAGGEVVIFDRSWYNRAGVEKVMGFCSAEEYRYFLQNVDDFEHWIVENDVRLVKYWLSVSNEMQERRFQERIDDPTKHWKLSPMDLEARSKWYDYSRARDAMFDCSDTKFAPWNLVDTNDKRRAHLNCLAHFLELIPYKPVSYEPPVLPPRDESKAYDDIAALEGRRFIKNVY